MIPSYPPPLLFPILKHTLKQTNSLAKSFSYSKNSFLKSHKNITLPQTPSFMNKDHLIQFLQKINTLSSTQLTLNKDIKYKSAISIIKPNSLVHQEESQLAQNVLIQISNLIRLSSNSDEPLPNVNSTPISVFVFLLQKTLFITKIKFQFHTFLAKIDFKQSHAKQNIEMAILESVRTCDNDIRRFLNIWTLLSEKYLDFKTYEYMMKLNQEFKSHLMRVAATYYQLIYNLSGPEPSTFTNFIILSNLLIKCEIQKLQLSPKQYQKLLHQQTQRKGFWPFSKTSSKQNNLQNQSHEVSLSMMKKNKPEQESSSMNHASFDSMDDKNSKKRVSDKRDNILKSNQNCQETKSKETDDKLKDEEQYLSKDESEVIEFYRNSMIQKMFNIEGDNLEVDFYKQFVVDMLNSYNFTINDNLSAKSKISALTNSSIEQTLIKVIYKDENMKGISQSDNLEDDYQIPYSKLLNRCNNILQHIRKNLFPAEYHQKGNFSSFLEFIMGLYEKIMIAHKNFVENEMANMVEYDGKNSFSQKAAAVQSINLETQNSFQVLYRINITVICIIADLYDVPPPSFNSSAKLVCFNTLLTLHQVSFNQLNFPNNFSIFERTVVKEQPNGKPVSTPSFAEYIKGLSHLNNLLLKAHQNTYKGLELCMNQQNQAPKPKEKMVKVESVASQKRKSQQYEEYEEFVLSYQNIIVQSLDELAVEMEDCLFHYFEKNKEYLMDEGYERFTYFRQISQNIMNYVSCLMMLVYKKNQGLNENEKELVPLKNNVMTSLKIVKVLEKVLVLFWEQFWEFDLWLVEQYQQAQDKEPLLAYVRETIVNLLKLLQKFSIPKEDQTIDYRYLKSALIMAPLLECYESSIRKVFSNPQLIPHLQKSKPFIKVLFQMNQRLSLPELMRTQVKSNLQTRTKLNQQVLEKIIEIFSVDTQRTLNSSVLNHNFQLLIEMLFDNFSRMKEKFEDLSLNFIGEQRFAIHMMGKLLREINSAIISPGKIPQTKPLLSQKQLQKLAVILQMYLSPQNYTIELQEDDQADIIMDRISQIQSAAGRVFYEMFNYVVVSFLKDGNYTDVVKMTMDSRFLATGYLPFMREMITHVKEVIISQGDNSVLSVDKYLSVCIEIYTKIMGIFTMDYDPTDNCQDTVSTLIIGSSIFQELLHFPSFTQHTNMHQLLSLQKIKKSLSSNRIFNTFELQVTMVEYLSANKQAIKDNFDVVVGMLEDVYGEISEISGKEMKNELQNYWFVNKMVNNFVGNSFVSNLYILWSHISDMILQGEAQKLEDLKPSRLISLINKSFVSLSKTFVSSIYSHLRTISNLTVPQTPTFTPQNIIGSKKDFNLDRKQRNPNNLGIQLTEEVQEEQCQFQINLSRRYGSNPTEQEQKQMSSQDITQKDMEDRNEQENDNINLIVSELQIPEHDQGNDLQKDQNGSTEKISEDKCRANIALADQSYFSCSKIDALKLYQQFYLCLFKQIQILDGQSTPQNITCEQLRTTCQDLSQMLMAIGSIQINNLFKLSLSEVENIAVIKCHLKVMHAFEIFTQKTKYNTEKALKESQEHDSHGLDEIIAKVYQLYLLKVNLIEDQELRQILARFQNSNNQGQNQQVFKECQKAIISTDQSTLIKVQQEINHKKQNIHKILIRKLQKLKQFLTERDQELSTVKAKQHFESFKDQLISFILQEYSAASSRERHERKNSFYFGQQKPQTTILGNLFEAIQSILLGMGQLQQQSRSETKLYEAIYKSLEGVMVECMDLSYLTKRVKQILKLNLKKRKSS